MVQFKTSSYFLLLRSPCLIVYLLFFLFEVCNNELMLRYFPGKNDLLHLLQKNTIKISLCDRLKDIFPMNGVLYT